MFLDLNPVLCPLGGAENTTTTGQHEIEVAAIENLGLLVEVVSPAFVNPDLIEQLVGLSTHRKAKRSGNHFESLASRDEPHGRGKVWQIHHLAKDIAGLTVRCDGSGEIAVQPLNAAIVPPPVCHCEKGRHKPSLGVQNLQLLDTLQGTFMQWHTRPERPLMAIDTGGLPHSQRHVDSPTANRRQKDKYQKGTKELHSTYLK